MTKFYLVLKKKYKTKKITFTDNTLYLEKKNIFVITKKINEYKDKKLPLIHDIGPFCK
jgi:hypothetical protein